MYSEYRSGIDWCPEMKADAAEPDVEESSEEEEEDDEPARPKIPVIRPPGSEVCHLSTILRLHSGFHPVIYESCPRRLPTRATDDTDKLIYSRASTRPSLIPSPNRPSPSSDPSLSAKTNAT